MKDPGNPRISELRHRVALCTQKDIVVDASTMELRREHVVWAWARVKSHYGLPSLIGAAGYQIMYTKNQATHAITVRAGLVEVTSAAYVYEEFRKSQPRWYKILGFSEPQGFLVLTVRMLEKSDFAIPPQNALGPLPSQVAL
jgi:hypothetical protein